MNKNLLTLKGIISLLVVNQTFSGRIHIKNEATKTQTGRAYLTLFLNPDDIIAIDTFDTRSYVDRILLNPTEKILDLLGWIVKLARLKSRGLLKFRIIDIVLSRLQNFRRSLSLAPSL